MAKARDASDQFFLVALVLTVGITLLTLTTSPPPWWDECQIIDFGRTAFSEPPASYGVSISPSGHILQTLNYVGCLIQEITYRATSGSMVGPRLSALLGAIFAALGLRAWLISGGVSSRFSTLLGCAFLWDPLIAQSYRGARVDCWCIGFMMWALFCLRRAIVRRNSTSWLIATGILVAISGLTWASAILLIPLLLQELIFGEYTIGGPRSHVLASLLESPKSVVWRIAVVAIIAAMAMAVLLLAVLDRLPAMIDGLSFAVTTSVNAQSNRWGTNVVKLASQCVQSPILPAVAIAGALIVGPRTWLLPFAIAICGATITRSSGGRIYYLVPYVAYGWAAVADRLMAVTHTNRIRLIVPVLTALILVWSAGVTLVARTSVALIESDRRDPRLADNFVEGLLGNRRARVLLGSWSLYYPLRSRGAEYWGPYDLRSPDEIVKNLDYDLVIHDATQGMHRLDAHLRARGYTRRVYTLSDGARKGGFLTQRTPGYGPYVVYTHPDWAAEVAKDSDAVH